MSAPPSLEIRSIRHSYATGFVLQIDHLDVPAGGTLCLLGPTGSGKSTLLKLLSGLEMPGSGQIQLAGEPLSGDRIEQLRRIVLVPQRPCLQSATVRQNVEFGLKVRHVRPSEIARRVTAQLEHCRLTALADRPARTLSGGQLQLAALARTLVIEPDVLLLDEPTASLDPGHVEVVEQLISEERRRRPMTVVWATHNLFQARRMADRVALLLDGRLIEDAGNAEFFDQPHDQRTAAFVAGRMIY